jgi:hypothetical protein
MRCAVLPVLALLLTIPFCVPEQHENPASIPQEFIGTWKLVSYVRQEIASGTKSDVMGSHPQGYINYGGDDRMIVMIVGNNRKKPAAVATPTKPPLC